MEKLFVLLIAVSMAVSAGSATLNFHSLEVKHGVSDNYIQSVLKDHMGYMWFATTNRLSRYDGYHFKEYSTAAVGAYNDNVEWISEDASGTLWLKTPVSYCFYNRELDRIENHIADRLRDLGLSGSPLLLSVDNDGRLWTVDSAEIAVHDFRNRQTIRFNTIHDRTGFIPVTDIAARGPESFILLADGQIYELDSPSRSCVRLDGLGPIGRESRIMIDSGHNLWYYSVSTPDLRKYSLKDRSWIPFPALQLIRGEKLEVMSLNEDSSGNIWIGTDHAGILIDNSADKTVRRIVSGDRNPFPLPSNHIRCMYFDSDNNVMWIGSSKKGVAYAPLTRNPFSNLTFNGSPDITCLICNPDDGSVWIGCDGDGIARLNPDGSLARRISGIGIDRVVTGCHISGDSFWWGTYGNGVYRSSGSAVTPLDSGGLTGDFESLPAFIRKLFVDRDGNLWIASFRDGLFRYDPRTHSIRQFTDRNSPLLTNYIADISEDATGRMIVVTSSGLYAVDSRSLALSDISMTPDGGSIMPGNSGNCLLVDSRGLIWIGSHMGVTVYDPKNEKVTTLGHAERLSHSFVRSIAEDAYGNIWMSTDHGVTLVRVSGNAGGNYSFSPVPFTEESGINDMTFNNLASAIDRAGHPLFGAIGGLLEIDPESVVAIPSGIPVVTDLTISNRNIRVGEALSDGFVPLPQNISLLERLELNYNTNTFALDISTMDYGNRPHLLYRINGEEWVKLEGNRIYFNNMSPGDYTLEVKSDNGPAEMTRKLRIVIRPPFWKSKLAYALYIILTLLVIAVVFMLLRRRHIKKMELEIRQMETDKQHQMDEAKMKFFTNISHDLRTPLSLILLPVEKLLDSELNQSKRADLQLIRENATTLLDEMNQLLDFRRLDNMNATLSLSHGNIVGFVEKIVAGFMPAAEKAGLSLSFDSSSQAIEFNFDSRKIKRIVTNLISNALKYNVPEGSVSVSVDEVADPSGRRCVTISVTDTGIGIEKKNRSRIFERFFQEQRHRSSTTGGGIGLHIVNEYVRLMGGTVGYEPNEPRGSVFTVTIPVDDRNPELPGSDPAAPDSSGPQLTGKDRRHSILIVEDNEDLLCFLVGALSSDYDVHSASNGKDALDLLMKQKIDIVVSDVMMPVMDGLELCRRIKSNIDTSHIPVILLTARGAEENKLEGLRDGADDYIPKPFNMEILRLRIEKFIDLTNHRHHQFARMDVAPSEITISSLDEQLISKAIAVIEKNIADERFSVEDLSGELGMSRGHLYKKLMSITGKAPLEFIRTIRLKRGRSLLEKSQLNISQIADKIGMSPNMFAKYFKEEFGVLPSAYRRDRQDR